jgi:bisphosphoglycerate-independent phosphoglycerate mutase (AlkP superfamily)
VASRVIQGIVGEYDFIVTYLANGDVIGHTEHRLAQVRNDRGPASGSWWRQLFPHDYTVFITLTRHREERTRTARLTSRNTTNPVQFILGDCAPPVKPRMGAWPM